MNEQRLYECMVVLDPEVESPERELESLGRVIREQGGEVQEAKIWQRRRLAYPIRRKQEGLYALLLFRASAGALPEVRRFLRLNEGILRYLLLRKEEKAPSLPKAQAPQEGSE